MVLRNAAGKDKSEPDASTQRIAGAYWVAGIVAAIMSAMALNIILNDGFDHGVGNDVFNAMVLKPWPAFIALDLMTGLAIMCSWMVLRERGGSIHHKIAWILAFLWWGNIAVAIYLLKALVRSGPMAGALLLGRRGGALNEEALPTAIGRLLCVAGAMGATVVLVRGLAAVGMSGVPAFGYIAGFATMIYGFVVFAFVPNRR